MASAVHERLTAIHAPYRDRLTVSRGGPEGLTLETPGLEGKPWGFVAGTRLGKRYVSFYLMSVYGQRDLVESMSPALRRRCRAYRVSTSRRSTSCCSRSWPR